MIGRLINCRLWLTILSLTVVGTGQSGWPADPTRDPKGWAEVQFGMTQEQVLLACPDKAYLHKVRIKDIPFMNGARGGDLDAAVEAAKTIVSQDEEDKGEVTPKQKAARELLGLIAPRMWTVFEGASQFDREPQADGQRAKSRVAGRLSGTLVELPDNTAVTRAITVQPRNKKLAAVRLQESVLDKESIAYIRRVDVALSKLSGLVDPDNNAMKNILKFAPVNVRDTMLQPYVDFDSKGVCRITLETPGVDNPLTPENPNRFGVQATIVDALTDKFGKPDEQNQTARVTKVIWRFPETVIICAFHKLGIEITYERPGPGNASGLDDL